MPRRIAREDLLAEIHPSEIDAPDTAKKAQAGQFVVIRADAREECMPLTVAGWDSAKSTPTVAFTEAGRPTPAPAAPRAQGRFTCLQCLLGMPTLSPCTEGLVPSEGGLRSAGSGLMGTAIDPMWNTPQLGPRGITIDRVRAALAAA